ncbi:HD domain-containing protein [Methylobacterium mesophilicum SR1.6/6]|uniref:HD domain-containing protein n=1 Tax=Methylobacterium mesophilicum SR1.6/6 TaxID=908290 RepID=A0A6B9FSD3_9HYPH|nr:HD domain-containing phosphohydrolase [Methylobacterium mesophilicum]QGY05511.1 HD domain-containing protein [Methylobacterium mesophilicum SR1.6/6]
MSELLLISDDLSRTERLARHLGAFRACRIHDLYDDAPPPRAELIVSDVKDLTSEAILRLRGVLPHVRGSGTPFLFLLHDNSARTHIQADLLGASGTLSAAAAMRLLDEALACLQEQTEATPSKTRRQADQARQFLRETFVPGRDLSSAIIDTGTEIVSGAVRESGIRNWIRAVRRFDDATHQHCLLVAGLAVAFAGSLGLGAPDRHSLAKAALLHDVGKIAVPPAILNKPGPLNAAEMRIMRTHPGYSHAMLVGRGFEETMLTVVRSHHEMLDGTGYPDRLKGCEIPDLVRLVTVCDVYGALIERRPYRAPLAGAKAFSILSGMTDRLDGDLVRAFQPVATAYDPSLPPATLPS